MLCCYHKQNDGSDFFMRREQPKRKPEKELEVFGTDRKKKKSPELELLWGEETPLFEMLEKQGREERGRERPAGRQPGGQTEDIRVLPQKRRQTGDRARAAARRRKRRRQRRIRLAVYAFLAVICVAGLAAGVWRAAVFFQDRFGGAMAAMNQEEKLIRNNHSEKPELVQDFLTPNEFSRPQEVLPEVTELFVHYTANPGTSAEQNRSYFENLGITGETSASSHFVIGYDGTIIQCLPLTEIGYAVKEHNYNSVSIECCYLDEDGKFTDETYDALISLLGWLMREYDLGLSDVKRHYDAGGKPCPLYYTEHPEAWEQLKEDLKEYILK